MNLNGASAWAWLEGYLLGNFIWPKRVVLIFPATINSVIPQGGVRPHKLLPFCDEVFMILILYG